MAPTRGWERPSILFLVSFLIVQSLAISPELLGTAQSKLDEMLQRSKSKGGLIEISGSDFEKFISRGPRPYFSLLVLTALSSGNCAPCEQLQPAIEDLAKMMADQRAKIDRPDTLFSGGNGQVDVFVVSADFQNNRNVFQKLGLSTAPTVVLVPPSKTKNQSVDSVPTEYRYSLTRGRSADDIGNWIVSTAKTEWLQFGSKMELPPMQYIVAALIVVPLGLWTTRSIIDKLRRSMVIYVVASMVAYTFIIGGGMFSKIRNTPWIHKDGNNVGYISHMSRYQFGVETYIVGGLNLCGGVAAFALIMAFRCNQPEVREHRVFWMFKGLPAVVPLMVMMVSWYGIMWCYNFKNGHYNFGHVGMTG